MKKLTHTTINDATFRLLTIVCLFMISQNIFAQTGFGIRGGVNFSQVYTHEGSLGKNITESLDTKTGWSYGVYGRIGKKIYFQPELLVSTYGGSINVLPTNIASTTPVKLNVKYTNFDVPLLVGFQPIKMLRIMAGPTISLKINEDQKLKDALKSYTSSYDYTSKSAVWGYQVGVGVHVLGLDIDLRRMGGISDVSFLNIKDSQSTQKTVGWQLSVGFKIL